MVRGKPEPELNCELMNIQEPREVSLSEDASGGKTYYLRLHEVKLTDIGDYQCSVTNKLGTVSEVVKLTRMSDSFQIKFVDFEGDQLFKM